MVARPRRFPVPTCCHGYQAAVATRGLGAPADRGAGVSPCARRTSCRVGGHRPALAGDDPTVDRADAATLAHLLTTALERSTPGLGETAAPRAQWAPARRTTQPCGAGTGNAAGRGGGGGDAGQARAVPPLPAPVVWG